MRLVALGQDIEMATDLRGQQKLLNIPPVYSGLLCQPPGTRPSGAIAGVILLPIEVQQNANQQDLTGRGQGWIGNDFLHLGITPFLEIFAGREGMMSVAFAVVRFS
jgi:hypothetical protein